MVESNTAITLHKVHDILLKKEMHPLIERNRLLKILTTVRHKIIFRAQKRMNCKLCGIIRRVLGLIKAVDHFIKKGKNFHIQQKLSTEF